MKKTRMGIPADAGARQTRHAAQVAQNRVIVFAEEALADFERIFEFNLARDARDAYTHIAKIRTAVTILAHHPEKIGLRRTIRVFAGRTADPHYRDSPPARSRL